MAQNKKKKNQSTETDQGMTQIINLEERTLKQFCYILCVQAAGRASIAIKTWKIFFLKTEEEFFKMENM